jgi:arsenite/tail-anchored protein-transporting ATPase
VTPGFLAKPPRFLFFTGKGGVGKTSLACASAIALADAGRRVLLVSTDPASNLDEVLGVALGTRAIAVPGAAGLSALNIDPEAAAREYRERIVGPYRGRVPAAYLTNIEEQLSGACTVEVAAFDEFAKLVGDPRATADFDHLVFDTAPTGHTLRLLSLPSAWSEFVRTNVSGASCIGPLAGLQGQRALYEATVRVLSDARETLLVLVSRPESSALSEAKRTHAELRALGIVNQHLAINGVFRSTAGDPAAGALARRCEEALGGIAADLAQLPTSELGLSPEPLIGVAVLRRFFGEGAAPATVAAGAVSGQTSAVSLRALIDSIAGAGKGVIMTMGKGGVGKTTLAAAIALELSARGHRVHLTTTDPAAHVEAIAGGGSPHLTIGRIDPAEETRRYVEETLATAGRNLDRDGRALLEEDLRSPCTEEVAVFRAFARTVDEGAAGFVVVDTAPTGHTLLLLDAAEAYHREVLRQGSHTPEAVRRLIPRLRDAEFTRIVIVTLPEATPVHEAERLQADLRRAGIDPFAWVVNQSLLPIATHDPVLAARRQSERPYLDEVSNRLAARSALVPWLPEPPVGPSGLRGILG